MVTCGYGWHVWVGGCMVVDNEDAFSINAERLEKGLSPLECEKCEKVYNPEED